MPVMDNGKGTVSLISDFWETTAFLQQHLFNETTTTAQQKQEQQQQQQQK